jgi:outer membrane cobalamin receptor
LCFLFFNSASQIKDTIDLDAVTILKNRVYLSEGLKRSKVDSTFLKQKEAKNLSEILAVSTPVFIKTYGQGGVATSSFRGTSASHTKVIWNGLEINSPMLGQVDFSQIPALMVNNVTLFHGGNSTINSDGALGGSIVLESYTDITNKFSTELLLGTGSFGTNTGGLTIKAGNPKKYFQSVTKLFYKTSDNDFTYKNNAVSNADYPEETRKDADYIQRAFAQEFYKWLNKKNIFEVKFWGASNDRSIPAPLVVNPFDDNEKQEDDAFRAVATWKHLGEESSLKASTGYVYEYLLYTNQIASIRSTNAVHSISGNVIYEKGIGKFFLFTSGLNSKFDKVFSSNYQDIKQRDKLSAFVNLKFNKYNKWIAYLFLRQQYVDDEFIPIIPSIGFEFSFFGKKHTALKWKGNITRNYNLPGLNDLYWYPGGNESLEPEQGVSAETGFELNNRFLEKRLIIQNEVTGFYSKISNWITWQPDEVFRYWSPENLKEVVSQGIEYHFNAKYKLPKATVSGIANYTYTDAKNMKGLSGNDGSVGKFLIYVPKHSANGLFRIEYKKFQLNWTGHYIGKRYTTSDNLRYMPDYFIQDVSLSKKFVKGVCSGELQFSVNNILGIDYQAIAWQPMPGRSFEVLLRLGIKR